MSKAFESPESGEKPLPLTSTLNVYETASSHSLLTVKYFHSLASVPCPSTKSKHVSTTPNLQHMKMGSVQRPSPKYGSAGGVVPEDQQRVNARRKKDRRIWLEL